jgi:hypothetical protein
MNLADTLNLQCLCSMPGSERLQAQLETDPSVQGITQALSHSHPHLFSQSAVYLDAKVHTLLAEAITAIEHIIHLSAYQTQALACAAPIAQHDWGPSGVFMGYDFHISAQGPRLIEINTNAGGAFLNAALARAHRACCAGMQHIMDASSDLNRLDAVWIEMFTQEWRAQRGSQPWRTAAIVDDTPHQQYLAPEFTLARLLLQQHGIHTVITAPEDLQWRNGALWHPDLPDTLPVDMVYNRLTDFDLSEPGHASLHAAYTQGAVVLTPHPRAHALNANKRNLVTLSNDAQLAAWGVPSAERQLLQAVVPACVAVTPERAQALWEQRRQWFFKPLAGFGSKGTYRGDKLTKKVWNEILHADYIAQALVPPSERVVLVEGVPTPLKLDVRAYTYQGQIQLLAARTYSGQTTNFRTPGGGFAPVVTVPSMELGTSFTPALSTAACHC